MNKQSHAIIFLIRVWRHVGFNKSCSCAAWTTAAGLSPHREGANDPTVGHARSEWPWIWPSQFRKADANASQLWQTESNSAKLWPSQPNPSHRRAQHGIS